MFQEEAQMRKDQMIGGVVCLVLAAGLAVLSWKLPTSV